jgi:hypothetical protein
MKKEEVRAFVGSFARELSFEVESEIKRLKSLSVEDIGGNIIVRMEIESPLLNHLYGVAWNPKKRPGT